VSQLPRAADRNTGWPVSKTRAGGNTGTSNFGFGGSPPDDLDKHWLQKTQGLFLRGNLF
jgi:hypothetical protein